MRLTPELIDAQSKVAYLNPLQQRELSLRAFKLPAIENLGVTQVGLDLDLDLDLDLK